MTPLTEVVKHPVVRDKFALLMEAAELVASPQIRNQGTLGGNVSQDTRCWYYRGGWTCYRAGGNICYADTPTAINREHAIFDADRCVAVNPSDTAPALDRARRADGDPRRRAASGSVNAEDYLIGPGIDITRMTVLQPNELLVAIRIPGDVGRRAVLLREGARPPGVGLPARQRRGGDQAERREHRRGAAGRQRGRGDADAPEERRGRGRRQAAQRRDGGRWPARWRSRAPQTLRHNGYKVPLMRNLVKRAIRGSEGGCMDFLKYGRSPWGETILTHVSWNLFWASLFAGILFFLAHAAYMLFSAHRKRSPAETDALEAAHRSLPAKIERHDLAARLFHWVMAASMFVLLFTAFLPVVGVKFAWVQWHWMAGIVLTASILFHIVHATFFLDFWSIWVGPKDIPEFKAEILREFGHDVPGPKSGKYPLGNRLYHLAIVVTGLGRDGDRPVHDEAHPDAALPARSVHHERLRRGASPTCSHGLAGVGLVGLVIAHVYFAVRPEKWWITKAMILGWITRRQYLEHHEPSRWRVGGTSRLVPEPSRSGVSLAARIDAIEEAYEFFLGYASQGLPTESVEVRNHLDEV